MKFKSILAWVKSHIGIVISCIVLLVSIPAAFVGSNMWMSKTLKDVEAKGKAELTKVDSLKIDYTLPAIDPSVPAISVKQEPNARMTEVFAAARAKVIEQSKSVVTGFEEFNRGVGNDAKAVGRSEHKPLVDGLFPQVAMSDAQRANQAQREDAERAKLNEMEDALLGKRGRPNPYMQTLAIARAGAPLGEQEMGDMLRDTASRYTEQVTSNSRQLTDEEAETMKNMLIDRRMGALRSKAGQLGVYASMDVFETPRVAGENARGGRMSDAGEGGPKARFIATGTSIEPTELTLPKLFLKQWDIWFMNDMMHAVALANRGTGDKPQGIEQNVVKRIVKMRVFDVEDIKSLDPKQAAEAGSTMEITEPTAPTAPTGGVQGFEPLDPSKSITGVVRGGWNKTYEVRRGELVVIASSARLQQLIAAISRTNLMTVTSVSIDYIDMWEHAREGYFYGDEHVVQVTMQIESLWLKQWLLPLMPVDLQKAMWMEVAEAPPS